ncbi:VanZ family protein [Luteolibacter sp. AS25]|uniref:VanZ family protein n=1 Tax=Luteolibacter sp. AS25 TaxID=3135776 RepID=UPI00398B7CDC
MRAYWKFAVSGVIIIGLLLLAWTYRYEAEKGGRAWSLNDMNVVGGSFADSQPFGGIRLSKKDGVAPAPAILRLPGLEEAEAIHLKYRIRMEQLEKGKLSWHRGRLAINWVQDENLLSENDPIHDFWGNGILDIRSRVVAPSKAAAVPWVWLQHLGHGGAFTLELLEVQPVRERDSWEWMAAGLGLTTILWFSFLFKSRNVCWSSSVASASICMLMICWMILPKPADIKPQLWGTEFHMGNSQDVKSGGNGQDNGEVAATIVPQVEQEEPQISISVSEKLADEKAAPVSNTQLNPEPASLDPAGTIVAKRSLVSWVQMHLSSWMNTVHILAFASPCFILVFLLRWKIAAGIGLVFAAASEGSQFLFADAWDYADVLDLVANIFGVMLGVLLAVAAGKYTTKNEKI